jgi:hypothetical protein
MWDIQERNMFSLTENIQTRIRWFWYTSSSMHVWGGTYKYGYILTRALIYRTWKKRGCNKNNERGVFWIVSKVRLRLKLETNKNSGLQTKPWDKFEGVKWTSLICFHFFITYFYQIKANKINILYEKGKPALSFLLADSCTPHSLAPVGGGLPPLASAEYFLSRCNARASSNIF